MLHECAQGRCRKLYRALPGIHPSRTASRHARPEGRPLLGGCLQPLQTCLGRSLALYGLGRLVHRFGKALFVRCCVGNAHACQALSQAPGLIELASIGLGELVHRVVRCSVLGAHGLGCVAAFLEFCHQRLLGSARSVQPGLCFAQALLHAPIPCDGSLLALQAPQGLLCLVQIAAKGTGSGSNPLEGR